MVLPLSNDLVYVVQLSLFLYKSLDFSHSEHIFFIFYQEDAPFGFKWFDVEILKACLLTKGDCFVEH